MKDKFLGKKMRDLRSVNKVNEDNASGFHSNVVTTGFDRAVTSGNDSPLPVTMPKFKESIKKSKDILLGKKSNGDDMNVHDDHSIISIDDHSVHIDNSVHHSSLGDGLAWFGTHWKEIAIVAGAAALILAISKLIKGLNKSIKIRYNRVVKTLQRAQKDFTLAEDGLNMKSVMPGIGSGIYDWISRMWTGNWKSKKHKNGNIGLHPFCSQYIEEIEMDFRTAQDAFSKIKLGADESNADDDRNTDASVGESQNNVSTSAYSGKVYSSFHEAYSEEFLNEGVSPDKVDESVLAMISAGVALTSLAVRAGQFLYQRYKNGKPVGEQKQIQVTKESTREICYAIINNYADKYVNMQQVFREIGINSQSLADIDTSACDKLAEILKKYQKPEKNSYTKQYERIEKAYRKMLKHYYAIGDGIISNFIKYSDAKDEKHSNLIVASREKLQNMWDSQKDFYDNNFSHVLIEIISSEAYINYLDFIIEKVIPVFKSGLASDADYVLDIVPKKGEYYLLRQTGNGQAVLGDKEVEKGNVAIAEVIGFDRKEKKMKFKLIGLVKGDEGDYYELGDDGVATLSTDDIDYNAYKEHDEFNEDYSKWLSLDPVLLNWTPNLYTNMYERRFDSGKTKTDQFIYAYATRDEHDKGFNKFVFLNTKPDTFEILSLQIIKIDNYLSEGEIQKILTNQTSDDEHNIPNFVDYGVGHWTDTIREYVKNYQGEKPEPEDVKNTDELVKKVNERPEIEENEPEVKYSNVYKREFDNGEKTHDQYVYAYGDKDDKDEFKTVVLITNKKDSNEILSVGVYNLDNYFTVDDLNKLLTSDDFDPKFADTTTNFSESQLKNYVEKYRGNKPEEQEIKTTDDLIDIINKKIEPEKAVKFSDVYKRDGYNGTDQRVYAYGDKDDKDEFNNIVVVKRKSGTNDILSINTYTLDTYHNVSDMNSLLIDAGFSDTATNYNDSELKNYIEKYSGEKPEPVAVHNTDELLKVLNDKKATSKYSYVYKRTVGDIDQYAFSYGDENDKYEFNTVCVVSTKGGSKEILSVETYKLNNSFTETDLEKIMGNFNPKFDTTGHDYYYSDLRDYLANYKGAKAEPKNVGTSDELIKSVNTGEIALKKLTEIVKEFFGNVSLNAGKFTINNAQSQNVQIEDLNSNQGNDTRKIKVTFKDPNITFVVAIPSKVPNRIDFSVDGVKFNPSISSKDWNVDNIISILSDAVLKLHQNSSQEVNDGNDISEETTQPENSSVNVTYNHNSEVSESYTTNVNITRKFDKRMRNWFVLSEAIYDDGSNKVSKLDNPRFRKALLERSDCAGFAKTSKLAKFMPYDMKQNYTLVSEHNYTPSVATPLYESVMLVKFDKMDRITEKNYLGKHKIG